MLQLDYRGRIEKVVLSHTTYLLILLFFPMPSQLSILLHRDLCYFHIEKVKTCAIFVLYHLQRDRLGREVEVKYLYCLAFHFFRDQHTCAWVFGIQSWMSSIQDSYRTLILPHPDRLCTMIWCMKWQTEAFCGDCELAAAIIPKYWQECLICRPCINPGFLTYMKQGIATLSLR